MRASEENINPSEQNRLKRRQKYASLPKKEKERRCAMAEKERRRAMARENYNIGRPKLKV
jgi:hypothetical protein